MPGAWGAVGAGGCLTAYGGGAFIMSVCGNIAVVDYDSLLAPNMEWMWPRATRLATAVGNRRLLLRGARSTVVQV